jgi:hypothetical protein
MLTSRRRWQKPSIVSGEKRRYWIRIGRRLVLYNNRAKAILVLRAVHLCDATANLLNRFTPYTDF